jgi:hypothetical protein
VEDFVQSHNKELTSEDLQEMDILTEHDSEEVVQDHEDTMPTSETKQHLAAWDNVKRLMSRHPAIEQTALTLQFLGQRNFLNMLSERKKSAEQTTHDSFFRNRPRLEPSTSEATASHDPSTSDTTDPPEVLMEEHCPSKN